jgi:hypothetical protein
MLDGIKSSGLKPKQCDECNIDQHLVDKMLRSAASQKRYCRKVNEVLTHIVQLLLTNEATVESC